MSALSRAIGVAAAVAIGLTLGLAFYVAFGDPKSPARAALADYVAALDRDLRFIRATVPGRRILVGQCATLIAAALAGAFGQWSSLVAVPLAVMGPKLVLGARVERRVARLEEQTESWLNAIANSLKASPSLGDAIASSITLVGSPMSEEVDLLVKECDLGTSLDRALGNLAERGRGRTLGGAVLALQIARRSGGNLTEMLESSAAALRELARLEGVVRTKTAEGKAQAVVIAAVPVPLVLGMQLSDPTFFEPLEATLSGHLVVAAAAALWAAAILVARKILAVDV